MDKNLYSALSESYRDMYYGDRESLDEMDYQAPPSPPAEVRQHKQDAKNNAVSAAILGGASFAAQALKNRKKKKGGGAPPVRSAVEPKSDSKFRFRKIKKHIIKEKKQNRKELVKLTLTIKILETPKLL